MCTNPIFEQELSQVLLLAHNMEDENLLSLDPIEDAAGGDDNLVVFQTCQLRRYAARLRVTFQSRDLVKNSLNQSSRCRRVIERDILGTLS